MFVKIDNNPDNKLIKTYYKFNVFVKEITNLIDAGCNVNCITSDGQSFISIVMKDYIKSSDPATKNKSLVVFKKMMEHDVFLEIYDKNGRTPLFSTIGHDDDYMLDEIIKCGVNLDVIDNSKMTTLLWACKGDNMSLVKKLIDSGADISILDNVNNNFMHLLAAHQSKESIIKECMPIFNQNLNLLTMKNYRGVTPLIILEKQGLIKEYKALKKLVKPIEKDKESVRDFVNS